MDGMDGYTFSAFVCVGKFDKDKTFTYRCLGIRYGYARERAVGGNRCPLSKPTRKCAPLESARPSGPAALDQKTLYCTRSGHEGTRSGAEDPVTRRRPGSFSQPFAITSLCSHSRLFSQPFILTALCSHSPSFSQPFVLTALVLTALVLTALVLTALVLTA
eukprot:gene17850-biopygen18913